MERVLTKFEKNGNALLEKFVLEGLGAEDLDGIFHNGAVDPEYTLSYQITETHVRHLQKFIPEKIDLIAFDYFVECERLYEGVERQPIS